MLKAMSTLEDWNLLDPAAAAAAILPCCGSEAWARAVAARRPFADDDALLAASAEIWAQLPTQDWQQAFDSHPRIGERKPQASATAQSLAWSSSEQSAAMAAEADELRELREANVLYEERFGRVFLIRARGRSTAEILAELRRRLTNTPDAEIQEAAAQQAEITALRLRAWLGGE
jgi:2-oxo-4-hydroxy-4-carboxy-5-ureidoimidazoline decarboxylase